MPSNKVPSPAPRTWFSYMVANTSTLPSLHPNTPFTKSGSNVGIDQRYHAPSWLNGECFYEQANDGGGSEMLNDEIQYGYEDLAIPPGNE